MAYDINKIRQSMQNASSKKKDPDEFRPATASDKPIKYRFFILPPLQEGDVLKTGKVGKSMDNFFARFGQHWVNDKPHSCPRIWDGSDCEICSIGFKLLKECKAKNLGEAHRQAINKQWMPAQYSVVNIHFTNSKVNPEELRGQTKFYRAPKTVYDKWEETILKDDAGDGEDPEAFGIFFDENAAFAFELVCTNGGRYNDYKQSKFIANGGVPMAMVVNEDKTPDKDGIKALLKSRINLWDKLEAPDHDKIKRLASSMIDGDDEEDTSNGGFDSDENEPPKAAKTIKESKVVDDEDDDDELVSKKKVIEEEEPAPKKNKPSAKPAPAPKAEVKPKDEDDDDEDISDLLDQLDD